MLSNQVLYKTVQSIRQITGFDCSVWDMQGRCLAAAPGRQREEADIIKIRRKIRELCEAGQDVRENSGGKQGVFPVRDEGKPVYALILEGGDSGQRELAGRMGAGQLESLICAYKEKMDKNRFIQNLLLGNILSADVYNQAKRMRIPVKQRRAVFLIEPKHTGDNLVLETMKGLYAAGTKDFVTAVDEKGIILVKALDGKEDYSGVRQTARAIADTLNMEAMASVRIAIGTIVGELKDVPRSFKEARMALEVGRVFYAERGILSYNELGIGRLIHQIPKSLCEMFLNEIFAEGAEVLEEEERTAVYTFFDNNLNISETARQLYLHRNTLMRRLEKVQKKTGLDVRVFDDALTFKIAMMVAKHIQHMKGQEEE